MAALFRIRRPDVGIAEAVAPAQTPAQTIDYYLDRLIKMIPTEVISLYMVVTGFVAQGQKILLLVVSILCLLGVFVVRIWGTADRSQNLKTDWIHVMISAVAFIIWVYWIGGPFKEYQIHDPNIASILLVFWSFFIPILYKGPKA